MLSGYAVHVAALIKVLGVTGHVRDTIRGDALPHRITWILWGFIPLVTVDVQIRAHVLRHLVGRPGREFLRPHGIVGDHTRRLGLRRGALTVIAVYAMTLKGDLAIVLLLTVELFAAVPTLRKSWKDPRPRLGQSCLPGSLARSSPCSP